MNYQDFFKKVERYSISGLIREDRIDFTIEELYQFFKARLLDETFDFSSICEMKPVEKAVISYEKVKNDQLTPDCQLLQQTPLAVAVHNCNDNIVGESPNYYCGICGQSLR